MFYWKLVTISWRSVFSLLTCVWRKITIFNMKSRFIWKKIGLDICWGPAVLFCNFPNTFFLEMKHAKTVQFFLKREREEQIWPEVNAIIGRKNWKTFFRVNFAYCFIAYILSSFSIHSLFSSIDSFPEVCFAHQFSHRNLTDWSN